MSKKCLNKLCGVNLKILGNTTEKPPRLNLITPFYGTVKNSVKPTCCTDPIAFFKLLRSKVLANVLYRLGSIQLNINSRYF